MDQKISEKTVNTLVDYCNDICTIEDEIPTGFIFGISKQKLEEKLEEISDREYTPEEKEMYINRAVELYKECNQDCVINLI